jgi:hypothetical protein
MDRAPWRLRIGSRIGCSKAVKTRLIRVVHGQSPGACLRLSSRSGDSSSIVRYSPTEVDIRGSVFLTLVIISIARTVRYVPASMWNIVSFFWTSDPRNTLRWHRDSTH